MIITLFGILFIMIMNCNFLTKINKKTTINLHLDINKINDEIKNNEARFYEYICKNINIIQFKEDFYKIIKQYNLIINNKMIFDKSLIIPNGLIFHYIFNQESCQMLLFEGIFCEIKLKNKSIPIHILL